MKVVNVFDRNFFHAIGRMLSATGFVALVCYMSVRAFQLQSTDLSFFATFPKFVIIVAISSITYVAMSHIIGLEESKPVVKKAKSILFGRAGGGA